MGVKPILVTIVATFSVVIFMVILSLVEEKNNVPNEALASLATCITDSGAKFYGAFWCSHCQAQKNDFQESAKRIPYIECSTANGMEQLPVCRAAGITSYPTWEFGDGSLLLGRVPLDILAERTGCDFLPLKSDE